MRAPDSSAASRASCGWNAAAMVVARETGGRGDRRTHLDLRLGGHAVRGRFNHFFRGRSEGESATTRLDPSRAMPRPGSTRDLLEGRIDESHPRELPPRDLGRPAASRRTRTRG